MRKLIVLSVVVITFFSFTLAYQSDQNNAVELQWETNFKEAVVKAKKENKALLVNFTGSDWCGWCIRLDKEVFSKEEFAKYADKNLVLVKIDFPRKTQLSEELKQQNQALAGKYGVRGLPTILLMDSNEEILLQTGYRRGGPDAYIDHLKAAIR